MTEAMIAQLKRELERAKQLKSDDRLDWNAWSIAKSALLTVAASLPPDAALAVMNIVGTIDGVYMESLR